jgi:glycosyltransferase involved in cell wall biosynthesis
MLKRKNTVVFGNYGYKTNQLDGQTMELRQMEELLKINNVPNVINRDISLISNKPLKVLELVWQIIRAKQVFYFAAQRNLRVLFPIMYYLTKIFGVKLHYFAVGGWLAEYLDKLPWHVRRLKKISGVYVELEAMVQKLENKFKFENASHFPNFRIFPKEELIKLANHNVDEIHCVYMARVTRTKGVFYLFELEKLIEKHKDFDNIKVTIDIYGMINSTETDLFKDHLKKSVMISYKGVLEPEEIYTTLTKYSFMLFPTFYPGEGLPGTIIDSYICRLPILASDWKYNGELIDDYETGILHRPKDLQSMYLKFKELSLNAGLRRKMIENIGMKRSLFSESNAINILKNKGLV